MRRRSAPHRSTRPPRPLVAEDLRSGVHGVSAVRRLPGVRPRVRITAGEGPEHAVARKVVVVDRAGDELPVVAAPHHDEIRDERVLRPRSHAAGVLPRSDVSCNPATGRGSSGGRSRASPSTAQARAERWCITHCPPTSTERVQKAAPPLQQATWVLSGIVPEADRSGGAARVPPAWPRSEP